METNPHPPKIWRVALAFVLAPFAATSAFVLAPMFGGSFQGLGWFFHLAMTACVLVAYPTALIFGLPTFFILKNRAKATVLNCALAGACVALAPWVAVFVLSILWGSPHSCADQTELIEGVMRAVDCTFWSAPALAMLFALVVAALGAFGGTVFWLVTAARFPRRSLRASVGSE